VCQFLFAAALFLSLASPPQRIAGERIAVEQIAVELAQLTPGYTELPTPEEREKQGSEYQPYPHFSPIMIIDDRVPVPKWASLIEDPELQEQFRNKKFTLLALYELGVGPKDLHTQPEITYIPFIASLDYVKGGYKWYNPSQGTLLVAGKILIHEKYGNQVTVDVTKFYDSDRNERVRRIERFNQDIALDFAQKVTRPILEHFFNSEPKRIEVLIK
jgi:hypothetical protein